MKKSFRNLFVGMCILILTNLIIPFTNTLSTVHAATGSIDIVEDDPDILVLPGELRDLIDRLQRGLIALELYEGPITGEVNADTARGIRTYQRQNGLKVTGIITHTLVNRIETAINIGKLLDTLSIARKIHTDQARQALLDNPSTRDLLEGKIENEAAIANRDPNLCYDNPTVRCLLTEALENAKTVNRSEMRNWAFGEILVAQARVGLTSEARDTARRIKDPRLIMAALGQIAQAQAVSGNPENALAAAAIIPDLNERANSYTDIAEILADQDNHDGALAAVDRLQDVTDQLEVDIKNIAYRARSSVVLAKIGRTQ